MKPGLLTADADRVAAAAAVAHRIKDLVGVTATVRLVDSGGIERSLGKAKRVVDLRR